MLRAAAVALVVAGAGCAGGLFVTASPLVDTQGHGGGSVRVGGVIGLAGPPTKKTLLAGHGAFEAGGIAAQNNIRLGGGAIGGARLGFHALHEYPRWTLAVDVDALLYGRSINRTLAGAGVSVHLLPTLQTWVSRRYLLGVTATTDLWGEEGVRGVFGLGLTFAFTDLNPTDEKASVYY